LAVDARVGGGRRPRIQADPLDRGLGERLPAADAERERERGAVAALGGAGDPRAVADEADAEREPRIRHARGVLLVVRVRVRGGRDHEGEGERDVTHADETHDTTRRSILGYSWCMWCLRLGLAMTIVACSAPAPLDGPSSAWSRGPNLPIPRLEPGVTALGTR